MKWRRGGKEVYDYYRHTQPTNGMSHTHVDGTCIFKGLTLTTDGENDVILNVYDGQAPSATRLLPPNIKVDGYSNLVMIEVPPIRADVGIHVTVTSDGVCSHMVFYDGVE